MPPRSEKDQHKLLSGPAAEALSRGFKLLVDEYLRNPEKVISGYVVGLHAMKRSQPAIALSALKYNITTLESLIEVEKVSPTNGSDETQAKLTTFLGRLQSELASW